MLPLNYKNKLTQLPEISGDVGNNLHIKAIFICRDESIFRNIYRKVQRVIDKIIQQDGMGGELILDECFSYLILNSETVFQKTISDACELVDHQGAAPNANLPIDGKVQVVRLGSKSKPAAEKADKPIRGFVPIPLMLNIKTINKLKRLADAKSMTISEYLESRKS